MMNKNGKIKGKFNVIDLLVILLIIAVIAGIVVRYSSSVTKAVKSDVEFQYVMRIQGVRDFTVDALKETLDTKSKLSDKKATVDLGEIVDIKIEPSSVLTQKSDGVIVNAPQEDRYTAYVTIKTHGKESDNSYVTADSNELSVGSNVEIYSKYVHTSGLITNVEKLSK